MKKKRTLVLLAALITLLGILVFFLSRKSVEPQRLETLRIGISDPISALILVAEQKNFFRRHGLQVSLEKYQAGAYALDDLLTGKVDVITASDFVLAIQTFKHPDLRTFGTICAADTMEVVARKDHGIERLEHLKGKRVGVTKGTSSEFFLKALLSAHTVRLDQIQTVDLKPPDLVGALAEGQIDAGVIFTVYLQEIKKRLGARAVSWSAQDGQDYFFLLITKEAFIKSRPRAITSLLKGVLEAEEFLKKHDREARNIVAASLNLAPEAIRPSWLKTHFRVRLDQDLLTLMEDEAQWAIRNRLVEGGKMPNYFNSIYFKALEKLKPEAVSIVH